MKNRSSRKSSSVHFRFHNYGPFMSVWWLMLLLQQQQLSLFSWALSLSSSRTALLSSSSSSFASGGTNDWIYQEYNNDEQSSSSLLVMRKQKASDKRTRRRQRGIVDIDDNNSSSSTSSFLRSVTTTTVTRSPMDDSKWNHKKVILTNNNKNALPSPPTSSHGGGRGRARKRSEVYSSLSYYHSTFLNLLTEEYKAEETEVLGRLEASLENPFMLEDQGHALFDMVPERRGNLFGDEVYRFTKAKDSVSNYMMTSSAEEVIKLPQHHKFSINDIILLTLQPKGSGDVFDTSSTPNHVDATSIEARVLNTGPTYVDVALKGGLFEGTFGVGSINDSFQNNKNNPHSVLRLRMDRFFSNVPYLRMVSALGKMTSLPPKSITSKSADTTTTTSTKTNKDKKDKKKNPATTASMMDPILRQTIVSTYGLTSKDANVRDRTFETCDVSQLAKQLSKPAFGQNSIQWTRQVMNFISSKEGQTNVFRRNFNGPQRKAIEAALTRKLTMIHGPPGTGKTSVASAIAFGFVHQCRNMSDTQKVLACAFSNVGADNLAEEIIKLGCLKVVRVGKASSVSNDNLLDYTLDAAIDRDPIAKKALEEAAKATANLKQLRNLRGNSRSGDSSSSSFQRDMATVAVKAAEQACRVAATKALREADVIVCTSMGAADSRLLSACGIMTEEELEEQRKTRMNNGDNKSTTTTMKHILTPDGLPALNLPFVIVDEACQSVEPATLIPMTSTDSCRSVVLLGDPCQLPPTVKTDVSGLGVDSPLSTSLMSRLAQVLPQPVLMHGQPDTTPKDYTYLHAKPTRQAVSFMNYKQQKSNLQDDVASMGSSVSTSSVTTTTKNNYSASSSYRKQFSGSLLLSLQYRMHPSISAFSSAIFYDGLLDTPTMLSQQRPFPQGLSHLIEGSDSTTQLESQPSVSVRFVDVGGRNNEQRGRGSTSSSDLLSSGIDSWTSELFLTDTAAAAVTGNTSYSNEAEANEIIHILQTLVKESTAPTMPQSIGIVTPYAAQVSLIQTKLDQDPILSNFLSKSATALEIKSVDAFQGRECDVILVSTVRSNRFGNIGFLQDWRRMNVAMTRAKRALVVVGCRDTLRQSSSNSSHWEAFMKWCDGMKCVVTSSSSLSSSSSTSALEP